MVYSLSHLLNVSEAAPKMATSSAPAVSYNVVGYRRVSYPLLTVICSGTCTKLLIMPLCAFAMGRMSIVTGVVTLTSGERQLNDQSDSI